MSDGMGSTEYAYDELSELTSETRRFNDPLADAPMVGSSHGFQLTYTYGLSGQLKSYTDPYGKQISYTQDKIGRLNQITGTSFGDVTTYVSNPGFRDWGAMKHLDYGNGYQMDATYDNRLQAATFKIDNPSDSQVATFDKSYEYYADGKLKLADESANTASNKFDRLFTYDQMGRVINAKSGIEAHGQTETNLASLPYRQTYTYSAFDNLTHRDSNVWNYPSLSWLVNYNIVNNRVTNSGYQYDEDRLTAHGLCQCSE